MEGIKMKCPKCQFENPDGVNFCVECGSKLEKICPECEYRNSLSHKFCGGCGHKLSPSLQALPKDLSSNENLTKIQRHLSKGLTDEILSVRDRIKGERKHVTAMFSDLCGYTAMAEKLDPEEVKEITSQLFSDISKIISKYEGFVEKFVGDAAMAIFGVPKAHEDDPLRAVKAAIEIHETVHAISNRFEEKIGHPLKMHTGINTGLVVTGEVDIEKGTHGIVGDTVNLASRITDLAEPGEILVSLETQRLIAPYFKTKALGSLSIKGKTDKITAYLIEDELAVESHFDGATQKGLTDFTGREQELTVLHSCMEKAAAGIGQFITVVGEAGVGKSRLLYEFRSSIERNKIRVWQGHCQSFWSNTNYFPFINVLRREHQLDEEKKPEDLHNKAVAKICAINQELEKYLPFYLRLLSIPSKDYTLPVHLEGQEIKNAFQDAIASICIQNSKQQPLLLILEDWQWADEASDSALKHLVGVIGPHSLMVVTIYRPIYSSSWSNWSYHTPIVLKPLDSLHGKNIIKSIFDAEFLPAGLVELLTTRTGGNPLFIEEVCRSLSENNVVKVYKNKRAVLNQELETLTIPDKVQAIISARLDRLDHDTKEALRIASVVGRRFSRGILDKLYTGKSSLFQVLEKLKVLEIIQQTRIFPEAEYWFRHAMTKQVVYKSLLKRRRKVLHGLVGQALEELYQGRIEEQINLLQYHFSLAESWSKAVHYGRQSAENASKLSQFDEAAIMFEQVLLWLQQIPENRDQLETQIDILLQLERLYETLGRRDRQQAIIDQLLSVVQLDNDLACLAEIYVRQGDLYTQLGRYDEAERFLNNALVNWRTLSDSKGESRTLRSMGFLRWHQREYKAAVKCNEEALTIDRERDDQMAIATDLTNLGAVWRNLGDHEHALMCLTEALQIYEALQNPVKQAFTLYSSANVHREGGALDRAIAQYKQAYEIFEQYHDRVMSSRALLGMASIYKEQGDVHKSLPLYENVIQLTRDTKYRQGLSHSLRALGDLLLALNKPRKALDHLLESTEVFAELKDKESEAEVWEKIGNIYAQNLKEHRNALAAWDKARKLQILVDDQGNALAMLEKMGQLTRQQLGDLNQALKYYHKAFKLSVNIGDRNKQGNLLNTMGIIEWRLQAYADALEHYEKAFGIYLELEDNAHTGLMLNSIGITLHKLCRYEEALIRLQEAVDVNRKAGEQLLEGHGLAAIGDIYRDIGENEQALYHYQASLKIRHKIGDYKGQGWMFHSLALVYSDKKLYDEARDSLTQAQAIADEYSDMKLHQACTHIHNQLPRKQ
jgi:class 3 adenylate cyclase/tetratricopeptide (TPR) repeat protein